MNLPPPEKRNYR